MLQFDMDKLLNFLAFILCIQTMVLILIMAKVIEIQNFLKGKGMKL